MPPPTDSDDAERPIEARKRPRTRRPADGRGERIGFLPIVTNWFDRLFIGVVLFVAIHLAWMRFLEHAVSIYAATAISVALGAWIISRG